MRNIALDPAIETVKAAIAAGTKQIDALIEATGLTRIEVQRALDSLYAESALSEETLVTGADVTKDGVQFGETTILKGHSESDEKRFWDFIRMNAEGIRQILRVPNS